MAKPIRVVDNTPVPRGGTLKEIRYYRDGRTKTIVKHNFKGRTYGWNSWADSDQVPYDK